MKFSKILLLIPPFTQVNTPYPSICYLKRFLTSKNIKCTQADMSIELFLSIFSSRGLETVFSSIDSKLLKGPVMQTYRCRREYIDTVDAVISFLQNRNPSAAYKICARNYLPEGERFRIIDDINESLNNSDLTDKARFLATLYIEDLCDFIVSCADPDFSIGRYSEKTGIMANSFHEFEKTLQHETVITGIYRSLLEKQFSDMEFDLAAISIPFPGNLNFAFRTAAWIRENRPGTSIVMGGGFVNTELRSFSNADVFRYTDYITLDDGEIPLYSIIKGDSDLVRTYIRENGAVKYCDKDINVCHNEGCSADYSGLNLDSYVSMTEIINPMHRLWSEGHWNKMTLAHGCYWHKCAFCDTSLDYILRFEPASVDSLISNIRRLISETSCRSFHFTDEAAPPSLLKKFCMAVIKEKLDITWWTNIRFEKNFTPDLCRLMTEAGCIAVAGGIEVASERVLGLINKGVTLDEAIRASHNLSLCGIMVHGYLMYGFPTQTQQEIVDSLEIVRQMFANGCLSSAYWHQYTMTAHSPSGMNPQLFGATILGPEEHDFAYNDLVHAEKPEKDFTRYSSGLKKAVYNFMYGNLLDADVNTWFSFNTNRTKIARNFVSRITAKYCNDSAIPGKSSVFWIGGEIDTIPGTAEMLRIYDRTGTYDITTGKKESAFITAIPKNYSLYTDKIITLDEFRKQFEAETGTCFSQFSASDVWNDLRELGLIII